jgi:hypothetical protein
VVAEKSAAQSLADSHAARCAELQREISRLQAALDAQSATAYRPASASLLYGSGRDAEPLGRAQSLYPLRGAGSGVVGESVAAHDDDSSGILARLAASALARAEAKVCPGDRMRE